MFHTHVASVCSKCCIRFRRLLHSSIFHVCKCFVFQRYVQRIMGARPERRGKGTASRGPGDGVRDAPRVLRTGRARPYLGSRLVLHHVGK
jgi:hypothetical protein